MTPIRSVFAAALDRFELNNQTVLVAVSGGIDSTTLLHLLCRAHAGRDITIHAAHIDHTLREESASDAAFAEHLARAADVPFHSCRVDVRGYADEHGCGLEAAARNLRYAFLADTAKRIGAATVLTGHTADDVVETVLMHLAKGGSVRALAGIPRERRISDNVRVIRPLMDISRAEIESYARENGLKWVEDASNLETIHLRNRVRHELLPVMRSTLGPGIGTNILRFAGMMGELATLVESMTSVLQDRLITRHVNALRLDLTVLSTQPRVIVDHYLQQELRLGHVDRDRLFSLVDTEVGTAASLSGGRMAVRDRGFISVSDGAGARSAGSEFAVSIADGVYEIGPNTMSIQVVDAQLSVSVTNDAYTVAIDVDKVSGPLKCRPWRSGDRIALDAIGGSKLVSDVLTDAKIDHSSRATVHVLADEQGILWVCGVRQADRARCSDLTVRYLQCRIE